MSDILIKRKDMFNRRFTYLFLIYLFTVVAPFIRAQEQLPTGYFEDAIRFSDFSFGGSSRFLSIGGANVALGGDLSSAYTNPAGLGFHRSSMMSISPGIIFNRNEGSVFDEKTLDTRLSPHIGHLGFVLAYPRYGESKNRGGAFSITFTRLQDFNNSLSYEGVNTNNSIVNFFLESVDSITPYVFFEEEEMFGISSAISLPYFTSLIIPDYRDTIFHSSDDIEVFTDTYSSFVPVAPTRIKETVLTQGAQNEWNISYGGNYDDILYYGVGLGIQVINYSRERTYTEEVLDSGPMRLPLDNLTYIDNLRVTGWGANLKFGLIYRLHDAFRIGVSAETPTILALTEFFSNELFVDYNNYSFVEADINPRGSTMAVTLRNESAGIDLPELKYRLLTPWRVGIGSSIFIGKKGFISLEAEYIGYHQTRLISNNETEISFTGDNHFINMNYESVLNLKAGLEIRLNRLMLRGGYAYYPSPLAGSSNDRNFITAGLGIRKPKFSFDLAVIHRSSSSFYSPYTLKDGTEPVVRINAGGTRIQMSFNVYFNE